MRSDEMREINPGALIPHGLDDAYVGHTIGPAGLHVAVYDAERCVSVISRDMGITHDEALEYLEHNTFCAYVGPNSPIYVRLTQHGSPAKIPGKEKGPCRRKKSSRR